MSPDDPRHGTPAGRSAHRKLNEEVCDACKAANALYQRRYRKTRELYGNHLVLPVGAARRVQALMCLGWSMTEIAERVGMEQKQLWLTTQQKWIRRSTAAKIAAAYDEMSDTRPPVDTKGQRISVAKTLAHARRQGYVGPIAWDDNIDDPDAEPYAGEDDVIDEVVVERLMSGRRVASTRAEKLEAMRRWRATGRSELSLCRMHGWKPGRYVEPDRQDGAA